jgi:hypothetical protein
VLQSMSSRIEFRVEQLSSNLQTFSSAVTVFRTDWCSAKLNGYTPQNTPAKRWEHTSVVGFGGGVRVREGEACKFHRELVEISMGVLLKRDGRNNLEIAFSISEKSSQIPSIIL